MNNSCFKKIYFKNKLTTELDDKGVESKNLLSLLPKGWNKDDFDYTQNDIKLKNTCIGYAIKTGKLNNITVIDFDNILIYREACELVPDLYRYYTVQTRRGMHVYFEYDESIKKSKIPKIDVQTNGKLVIGPDTKLHRYNGETMMYNFMGGKVLPMPKVLKDWCCIVTKTKASQKKDFESSIDYQYQVTDEECRWVLDQMVEKHRDYFTEYTSWLTFTAIMKTINKQHIWDEYSQKYDNDNYSKYKNMSIWRGLTAKISINFFCHLLNIPAFKYHKQVPENELYNEVSYDEETTKEINLKYVKVSYSDFKKKDTIIIESGTGTGKTTCVAKMFHQLQQEERCTILSIVNLISLAEQQKVTFAKNGVDLALYNEEKVNPAVIISHNACICINSLHKLSDCNFRNKIVYIDEIYSLCMTLTHNDMLHQQRKIFNTLYRIIMECKKLVVSDAHIHNNVLKLLNPRLFCKEKTFVHYWNEYQKFNGTPAVRYNDENDFYRIVESKVMNGESFSFGSDSKAIIEKWFSKLYACASLETQQRMFLFTSEVNTELQKDWNNKIIFYSPKITTGVDITCINSSEQFMYITGQSVSSINLLQMATRTRNMTQLSYYSNVRSSASKYEDIDDCFTKVSSDFVSNQLGYSCEDIEDFVSNHNYEEVEDLHLNLYVRNCYALDLHSTNIVYFFEQELKNCGFTFLDCVGKPCKMDKAIQSEFQEQTQQNRDEKFERLLNAFHDFDSPLPTSVQGLMERCNLLNVSSAEDANEYREVIEDDRVLEHFFNYNALKKSFSVCEEKIRETINKKMTAGIHHNHWFKIKYVHLLAKECGIEDNLFAIEDINMPELTDKTKKLFETVKRLYRKRDEVIDYNLESVKQLYKFMIDNLTKKLKLIKSVKSKKRDETRDKLIYTVDDDVVHKYDRLIEIMTPDYTKNLCIYLNFPEEDEE